MPGYIMNFSEINRIFFLGIGGIGMSALARYFKTRGMEIFGYDRTETTLTKTLVDEGMKIHYEDNPELIPDGIDLVVWTPAIPADNEERRFFEHRNIPMKKRAEVLGIISKNSRTIAIAGTHGKTTTSALLTYLLQTGGIDCTAFLGGIAQNYQGNFVDGKSDWVVVEADEYDRSFLHLSPVIAAVLSMDPDHLDIYGDLQNMHDSGFKAFVQNVQKQGTVYVRTELAGHFEKLVQETSDAWKLKDTHADFCTYGIEKGQFQSQNLNVVEGRFHFDFSVKNNRINPVSEIYADNPETAEEHNTGIPDLVTAMPGKHNVENATVAIAIALQLGVSVEDIRRGLATFKGIKRRFEVIFRDEQTVYIDDYAHHPKEIAAAVQAARDLFPDKKITGVFQPHLFSRTRDFQDEFAAELDKLDEVVLLDIYPAREKPMPGVSADIIFDKMMNPNRHRVSKSTAINWLKGRKLEVLLTLGAGDIDTLVDPIKRVLQSGSKQIP